MKTYFEHKHYLGEYDETTGFLYVKNVYTNDVYARTYVNKYSAKRGFERIVSYRLATE